MISDSHCTLCAPAHEVLRPVQVLLSPHMGLLRHDGSLGEVLHIAPPGFDAIWKARMMVFDIGVLESHLSPRNLLTGCTLHRAMDGLHGMLIRCSAPLAACQKQMARDDGETLHEAVQGTGASQRAGRKDRQLPCISSLGLACDQRAQWSLPHWLPY